MNLRRTLLLTTTLLLLFMIYVYVENMKRQDMYFQARQRERERRHTPNVPIPKDDNALYITEFTTTAGITYFKDSDVNICYGKMGVKLSGGDSAFTFVCVPCAQIEKFLAPKK